MDAKDNTVEIDLLQILHALWKKVWAILLAALIFAACAFSYTYFLVTPLYKSRILLYVNNNSFSVGGTQVSISQGDLVAAKNLVSTYITILETRSTLEEVIEEAKLPYTYEELSKMIKCASENNTEIFYVEVTSPRAQEAALIANTIGQIVPNRISSIVEGSSVRIVDHAVTPTVKASPSLTKNTAIGFILGALLACCIIVILELMDDQIHDSDILLQSYDVPILAVIPDLLSSAPGSKYYRSSYGYGGDYAGKGR